MNYRKSKQTCGLKGQISKPEITLNDKPATKRGMLSELSSVNDPLGLASSFILIGRRIIQKLYQGNTGWDDGPILESKECMQFPRKGAKKGKKC